MNKHKLMLDILKDTRDYYAEDPDNRRSISEDGECLYTWGDSHCAVGRYLKEEYQVENWKNNNESVNELCDASPETWDIDWALREEAQGLDPDFWRDLQDFHDGRQHWNCETKPVKVQGIKIGLSDRGKQYYVGMEDNIVEGRYDE
tara:strand:+ start:603 stop:1040 length:438 start_codon:yes stop_codon:yes gene_type:complete